MIAEVFKHSESLMNSDQNSGHVTKLGEMLSERVFLVSI